MENIIDNKIEEKETVTTTKIVEKEFISSELVAEEDTFFFSNKYFFLKIIFLILTTFFSEFVFSFFNVRKFDLMEECVSTFVASFILIFVFWFYPLFIC